MKHKKILQIVAWEVINPSLLKCKKNKLYTFDEDFSGINLGCGLDNPSNWIGIDGGISHVIISKAPKFIAKKLFPKFSMKENFTFEEYYRKIKNIFLIHHELRYGIPFKDNMIPNIYSSHFLEHLSKNEGEYFLKECLRALKPGGVIRIAVPSLEKSVSEIKISIMAYEQGDYDEIQPYVTSKRDEYVSSFSNHGYMYNFQLLERSLEKCGFTNIEEFSFRKGNILDVEKLDTRPSLFIEAIKPKL